MKDYGIGSFLILDKRRLKKRYQQLTKIEEDKCTTDQQHEIDEIENRRNVQWFNSIWWCGFILKKKRFTKIQRVDKNYWI